MSPQASLAAMNDLLRTSFMTGRVLITRGIQMLPDDIRANVLARVRDFKDFTPENDPYGEHDFGVLVVEGAGTVYFKIDYYDLTLEYGSDNPLDPTKTTRVLTIMLAEEY
jgi:hypothetical protein